MMPHKYYKIVDLRDGNYCFLYHGINGSRQIPVKKWITADKKQVIDGSNGTKYQSGFHVFKAEIEAIDYLRRFKRPHKAIITVLCKGLKPKLHSKSNIFLAGKIMVCLSDILKQRENLK